MIHVDAGGVWVLTATGQPLAELVQPVDRLPVPASPPALRRMAICQRCTERPPDCWKAVEYGCAAEYQRAARSAAETGECPIGNLEANYADN